MARQEWDLLWTSEGDFAVGVDGDFADTKLIHQRALIQRVVTRLESSPGDWEMAGDVGMSLDAVMGLPNTREVGLRVEQMIAAELQRGGLLRATEFSVIAFPASNRSLGILLKIIPIGTRGETTLTFVYDMRDNRLIARRF